MTDLRILGDNFTGVTGIKAKDSQNNQYTYINLTQSDEGKVVSNGALVAQTSDTVTANDTYDTTLINSLTVNVSGSSGWTDDEIATRGYSGAITLNTTTSIIERAFNSSGITSVTGNAVTTINAHGFSQCNSLISASFPNLTGLVYGSAFANSSNLESVNFPGINYFSGGYVFSNCKKLTSAMFPRYSHQGNRSTSLNLFEGCTVLSTVDLGACSNIDSNCFKNCTNLNTIVLRRTTTCGLGNVNAFAGSPFASGGTGGTIYIPKTLYDHLGDGTSSDYQSATNWSTVHGYGTITWAKIEGSIYELPSA